MSTNKADNKALNKANQTATKGFPKSKIKTAFGTMADLAGKGEAATEARQAAALDICKLAHGFRTANADIDTETVAKGWRDNLALVTKELAVAGNRFAELTPAKGDKPETAKLTGYGNNVASIAKGCIEFDVEPMESYRETRKEIEAKRQEARRVENPELAALNDAKAACDEAWQELRKLVYGFNDTGLVGQLTDLLQEQHADIIAQREAAQTETEGEEKPEAETKAA